MGKFGSQWENMEIHIPERNFAIQPESLLGETQSNDSRP